LDGERIDPLTISDACTRYLLRCQAVDKMDTTRVQAIFEAAFREYGLPEAIRTDNGAPFASLAIAGLSRLALWWMKLGIVAERIQPAHPEQNGRHERMHLTLQQETMTPMAAHRRAQQRRFDHFRREYNEQRPHQALDMRTPADCYTSSPRPYPARVPEPEYDCSMMVRRVAPGGQFSWKHHEVFVSETLQGERIGLEPIDDRWYMLYFAQFPLGRFDSRTRTVHRLPAAAGLYRADAGEGEPPPSPAPLPQNPDQICQLCPRSKLSTMCPAGQFLRRFAASSEERCSTAPPKFQFSHSHFSRTVSATKSTAALATEDSGSVTHPRDNLPVRVDYVPRGRGPALRTHRPGPPSGIS
jgi:hypothetical protein